MESWKVLRKQWLRDPEIKREYDKLGPRYAVIEKAIEAKIKKRLK